MCVSDQKKFFRSSDGCLFCVVVLGCGEEKRARALEKLDPSPMPRKKSKGVPSPLSKGDSRSTNDDDLQGDDEVPDFDTYLVSLSLPDAA